MSELRGSKPVRRSDLNSRYPSAEPDSPDLELEARFRERLRKSCQESIDIEGTAKSGNEFANAIAPEPASKEDEEVYEFRLFAKPLKPELSREPNHSLQKIALRSPTPKSGEAGFLKTRRPDAYYFTGAVSAERTEQYQRAAVSGGEILEGLKTTWQGLVLPWRVIVIKSTKSTELKDSYEPRLSPSGSRKRSGKKRRIATRKKMARKSAIQSAARQSQAEKEAAEKEKRTRKNREKKVKRKQKEKLKKSIPD